MSNKITNRKAICDVLLKAAETDRDIIVTCSDSRGSASLAPFFKAFPEQSVEVGIADQNLVTVSAGLAACGKKVFAASPASFLSTRSYEQCKVDVAFSGLGAPYRKNDAKALLCGMTRVTGRNEIVKAGLESIAYQISDVLAAMEKDSGQKISELRVDGGPTKNGYLMQFQSDISDVTVRAASREELSAIGAGFMAGITLGIYDADITDNISYDSYHPEKSEGWRGEKLSLWRDALRRV